MDEGPAIVWVGSPTQAPPPQPTATASPPWVCVSPRRPLPVAGAASCAPIRVAIERSRRARSLRSSSSRSRNCAWVNRRGLHRSLLLRSTITPPAPIPAKRTAANGIVMNEATPTARRTAAASGRAVRAILVRPDEARRLGTASSFGAARPGRSVTSFVSASMVSVPSGSVSTLVCAFDASATRCASGRHMAHRIPDFRNVR